MAYHIVDWVCCTQVWEKYAEAARLLLQREPGEPARPSPDAAAAVMSSRTSVAQQLSLSPSCLPGSRPGRRSGRGGV